MNKLIKNHRKLDKNIKNGHELNLKVKKKNH